MAWDKDLAPGEAMVACFRPFIQHLASSGLTPKTIRKHIDHLWILGGEIIRDLNETPSLRRKNVNQVLLDAIDDEGGPLLHGGASEEQQRSFDSTCRKLPASFSIPQPELHNLTHRFLQRGVLLSTGR
jgi:hypothetical protein